jgi:hypothetical protein
MKRFQNNKNHIVLIPLKLKIYQKYNIKLLENKKKRKEKKLKVI